MLETRIPQLLARPPEWLALDANPQGDTPYRGRYLTVDSVPCALGQLLGRGDEAFVFELIELRGGERAAVAKICRHPPGSPRYATWAVPYRIEGNPHSAIPDVEMYVARLVRVPGGIVKIQPFLGTDVHADTDILTRTGHIVEQIRRGDLRGALDLTVRTTPQRDPYHRMEALRGRILGQAGRWDEAREVLEPVVDRQTRSRIFTRFSTGVYLARVLHELYTEAPKRGATLSLRFEDGTVHTQTLFTDPVEAAEDDTLQDRSMYILLEILADEPYFIPALLMLAELLLESPGTHLFAPQVLDAIERIDPGAPQAVPLRTFLNARYGAAPTNINVPESASPRHEDAGESPNEQNQHLLAFDAAYKPEPAHGRSPRARYQSAQTHLHRGDVTSAEQAVRDAIALDATKAAYPILLSQVLERRGAYDEASQVLLEASAEFSDEAVLHERLGEHYQFVREDLAAAELAYLRALHSEPTEPWQVKARLGQVCLLVGRRDDALTWLREADHEHPLDPYVIYDLVYLLAAGASSATKADVEEATELLAQAMSSRPEIALWWVARAQLLVRSGQYDDAFDSLHEAISLDPDHRFARELLAELEMLRSAPPRRKPYRRRRRGSRSRDALS